VTEPIKAVWHPVRDTDGSDVVWCVEPHPLPSHLDSSLSVKSWRKAVQHSFDWAPKRRVSIEEIEAAKTAKGGWTYQTFAGWGVPTPPPKGWKQRLIEGPEGAAIECSEDQKNLLEKMMAGSNPRLIAGEPFGVEGEIDIDPAKLLRKVVTAVINSGQAHILYEFPDILAFFGALAPGEQPNSILRAVETHQLR
jgi:hypothetical protein